MTYITVKYPVHERWSELERKRLDLIQEFKQDLDALDSEFIREMCGEYDPDDCFGLLTLPKDAIVVSTHAEQ